MRSAPKSAVLAEKRGSTPSRVGKNLGPEFDEFGFRDSESVKRGRTFFGFRVCRVWGPRPRIGQNFRGAFHIQVGGFGEKWGSDPKVELEIFGLEFGEFGVRDPESTQKFRGAFHTQVGGFSEKWGSDLKVES